MTLIERCRQVLTDDVIAEIVRKADAYFRERQPVAEWLDTSRDHLLAVLAPLLTEAEQERDEAKNLLLDANIVPCDSLRCHWEIRAHAECNAKERAEAREAQTRQLAQAVCDTTCDRDGGFEIEALRDHLASAPPATPPYQAVFDVDPPGIVEVPPPEAVGSYMRGEVVAAPAPPDPEAT